MLHILPFFFKKTRTVNTMDRKGDRMKFGVCLFMHMNDIL